MATDFEEGVLVGLLVGEGHFGGDGRQPHATLRMHERHEALFRWLERTFPGGRLYGPYEHGGRRYYQWMARGAFLRDELVPLLLRTVTPSLDRYAHARLQAMLDRYARQLGVATPASLASTDTTPGQAGSARPVRTGAPADTPPAPPGAANEDGPPAQATPPGGQRASEIFARLRQDQGSRGEPAES